MAPMRSRELSRPNYTENSMAQGHRQSGSGMEGSWASLVSSARRAAQVPFKRSGGIWRAEQQDRDGTASQAPGRGSGAALSSARRPERQVVMPYEMSTPTIRVA